MGRACTVVVVALTVVLQLGGTLRADQTDPRLDDLFVELRSVDSDVVARAVESEIWSLWLEIDDRVAALNLVRGVQAMQLGRLERAEASFAAAIARRPDFAEAWNKRATVRFLRGDLDGSVADIQATLALEPRHFGALSGLGLIYDRLDDPAAALRSYEAAVAVHPHLSSAQDRIDALRQRLDGRPI